MKKTQSILIIEDNEWLAESYARVLKQDSYNVCIANNAVEAIEAIDDFKPDAIILDMLLTGSTALTLMHELQSYDDTARIPIILCTNLAAELSIKELSSYGVCKIIDKTTMHPGDISAAIRSVL